jgi:hypothetical protein
MYSIGAFGKALGDFHRSREDSRRFSRGSAAPRPERISVSIHLLQPPGSRKREALLANRKKFDSTDGRGDLDARTELGDSFSPQDRQTRRKIYLMNKEKS